MPMFRREHFRAGISPNPEVSLISTFQSVVGLRLNPRMLSFPRFPSGLFQSPLLFYSLASRILN